MECGSIIVFGSGTSTTMKNYVTIGLVGLAIQAGLNLLALVAFKKTSAEFFSDEWWSSWLPTYTVWLVFLILGLASCGKKNGGGER